VKAALRVLRVRHGTAAKLAAALNATAAIVKAAIKRRGRVSAGLALRVARLAGVHMEDVLSGAWPKAGSCPMCGRAA
jgi:plasmid maintenance system antidote protein VapI